MKTGDGGRWRRRGRGNGRESGEEHENQKGKKQEEENGGENRNENSREGCTLGGPLGMGRPSVPGRGGLTDAGRRVLGAPGTVWAAPETPV